MNGGRYLVKAAQERLMSGITEYHSILCEEEARLCSKVHEIFDMFRAWSHSTVYKNLAARLSLISRNPQRVCLGQFS